MNSAIYGQLHIFHSIVAQGNISAAARQLGIGAPAVSKSLKLLEDHIGLLLFNRTTRQMELTEAGLLLLNQTQGIVESLAHAVESVQDLGNRPFGHVRITVARFTYICYIQPYLAEFHQRYPDIELEISVYDGEVDLLSDGYHLGIRFGDKLEDGVVARQLASPFREGLYVSQGYIDQYGVPHSPADLHQHKLIGYRFISAKRILPLILSQNNQELTIEMPHSIVTNDIHVMADGVRQGLGIGRLFTPVHARLADQAQFIPVLEKYWRTYPAVYLYYLQDSQKAQRIRVLIDFLLERIS